MVYFAILVIFAERAANFVLFELATHLPKHTLLSPKKGFETISDILMTKVQLLRFCVNSRRGGFFAFASRFLISTKKLL